MHLLSSLFYESLDHDTPLSQDNSRITLLTPRIRQLITIPLSSLSLFTVAVMTDRPEHPRRQPSVDHETLQRLERRLSERPDKNDLVERNILKDDKGIAPSLVAAKEKLQRSQLEDKLESAVQNRPKPEELIKKGILKEDEAPPSSA